MMNRIKILLKLEVDDRQNQDFTETHHILLKLEVDDEENQDFTETRS